MNPFHFLLRWSEIRTSLILVVCCLGMPSVVQAQSSILPIAKSDLVFAEKDGLFVVEAEHFVNQTQTNVRAFHLTSVTHHPEAQKDGDPTHLGGASGGAYLEILPDTRRTHADRLIKGENFSADPGQLAVLSYKVHISTPGRYYVWARAYSTGTEDNGLHVGLDGEWPTSGQRLQWCGGKNSWRWESLQRTEAEHCGEPHRIFLDVAEAGEHVVQFSMREDGFEFDKWLMTLDKDFVGQENVATQSPVYAGELPSPFPTVAVDERFPRHWGDQPQRQTRDLVTLPGGYGTGSSTLAKWIRQNIARDAAKNSEKNETGEHTSAQSPTVPVSSQPLIEPRQPDGDGSVAMTGELKQWHKLTLTLNGPYAHEQDNSPNPFTDLVFEARFTHEDGTQYTIPGYFAADGNAANTSAESGTQWRVHFSPDRTGKWTYQTFGPIRSKDFRLPSELTAEQLSHCQSGSFNITASDKQGRDLRAHGRLQYVGSRYLQFAGSKQYFLKAGADAPETLLGYVDFDNTIAGKPDKVPLKTWQPHVRDWKVGDPVWKSEKGKGLIGAINYLSRKGCNAFSFLTYNAGGDGDNVWPFIHRDDKLHYDCSKLDQWGIVFDHAAARGMYLHFKMQETENDDHVKGKNKNGVPESLDGGDLGVQRKLYCRELIARFGHNLALNWNLGEENTQTTQQQQHMINYIAQTDPYHHNIVVHTYPEQQEKVYRPLLGEQSRLTGISLQNSHIKDTHHQTVKWVSESTMAGKPWIVAFDESGSAAHGQCPDIGYKGFDGKDRTGQFIYTEDDVRHQTLWGTLMGGGAGVEYYFGYQFVENDLLCEDWRSRDRSWDYCRIALNFFHDNHIPFVEMQPADELVGNAEHDNSVYCLAKPGDIYLIYLPAGGTTQLDLSKADGQFSLSWFNPRRGGDVTTGDVKQVTAGATATIGPAPDQNDWLVIVKRAVP